MLPPVTPASSALSRRTVLRGAAAVGVGALAVIARPFDVAVASAPALHGIFGYGVASGDPTGDRVVIWTRATPPSHGGEPVATPGSGFGQRLLVEWVVATDSRFRDIVRRGQIRTDPRSDHTVKVDVGGLRPYTRYWFRFEALGQRSVTGRTQTAPDEKGVVHALRLALVSCSNYTGGYFGAYRGIAERDDLDLVLHVGDYIYEYGNGADRYGPASLAGVRDGIPATETIDLRDYRLRHALHKADPDLQAAHSRHPWITIFDDHEVANNTWDTGAEDHTSGVDGDFAARRRQAYQAHGRILGRSDGVHRARRAEGNDRFGRAQGDRLPAGEQDHRLLFSNPRKMGRGGRPERQGHRPAELRPAPRPQCLGALLDGGLPGPGSSDRQRHGHPVL